MSYYLSEIKHYVSVDCVIFGFQQGSLNLLLLKRKMEPAQGQWSLMGGFVRSDESVDDAAKRVLAELTGLENVYMEQVHTFGAVGRDPGERVISVVYYALINIDEYDREAVYQHNAYWVNIDEVPPLIFDHEEMVALARESRKPHENLSASTFCPSCSRSPVYKVFMKPSMEKLWTNGTSVNGLPIWITSRKPIKSTKNRRNVERHSINSMPTLTIVLTRNLNSKNVQLC